MNNATFENILITRIGKIQSTLASKAKEYATSDRLHNFKVAARRLDCTPERALVGMKEKHCVSVQDIVNDLDKGILPTDNLINEKIGDEINYLILLEALLKERLMLPEPSYQIVPVE